SAAAECEARDEHALHRVTNILERVGGVAQDRCGYVEMQREKALHDHRFYRVPRFVDGGAEVPIERGSLVDNLTRDSRDGDVNEPILSVPERNRLRLPDPGEGAGEILIVTDGNDPLEAENRERRIPPCI